MSQPEPSNAAESVGNDEPTADEPLSLGGRLGLLLLEFVVLAVLAIELGRFVAALLVR